MTFKICFQFFYLRYWVYSINLYKISDLQTYRTTQLVSLRRCYHGIILALFNIPVIVYIPHKCNQTCSSIKYVKGFRHQIASDVSLPGVRHFTIEQFTKPTFGINAKTSDNQHKSTWKFETLEFYILR